MKPVRLRKVPFVLLVPDVTGDARAVELLHLAASRGWLSWPEAFSFVNGSRGRQAKRLPPVFVPASWQAEGVSADGCQLNFRESALDLSAVGLREAGAESWVGIRNGRYAVEVDEAVLEEALAWKEAEVLAVTLEPKRRAYREKLRVGAGGGVLGFRRLYRDEIVPVAVPPDWPHLLLLRRRALERFGSGRSVPASFGDLMHQWREHGVHVESLAVGGLVWDLGSSAGLSAFFQRVMQGKGDTKVIGAHRDSSISSRARLHGTVIVESDVRVEDGAVILGPTFLGQGARVGRGALVHRCILAPHAQVGTEEVVRDQVISRSFRFCAEADTAPDAKVEPGGNSPFRHWPWFSYARLGKRLIDIAGSMLALALTVLIFPLVAIAIKLNSKGPVFYVHRRQGRHGREFPCIKFRTMVTQAQRLQEDMRAMSDVDGPQFKVVDDPRVTLVGSFLRETNLDEVPQFINVLRGQMSIVGPRPSPDAENQMCPAWREARLSVRPGITGLWQVSHSRKRTNDFQEWIYYDTEYVRNLSLWLDLTIMAKTVKILLAGFARLFVTERQEEPTDSPSAVVTGPAGAPCPIGSADPYEQDAPGNGTAGTACSPVPTTPERASAGHLP